MTGLGNSIQSYLTLQYTQRVYSHAAVNRLSSRTFGTWTCMQSLIRFYAAYNVSNAAMYQLAMLSYFVSGLHFFSEWLVFRTTDLDVPLAFPLAVSACTSVWMSVQYSFYVSGS